MAHDVNGHSYCRHDDPYRRWWCVHRFLITVLIIWTAVTLLLGSMSAATPGGGDGAMVCHDGDGDGAVEAESCRMVW